MSALPEDDAPTMAGTPGERHVDVPDGDDTTTAAAGPPASAPEPSSRERAGHEEEDRTVQQVVEPPPTARKPLAAAVRSPEAPPSRPASTPALARTHGAQPSALAPGVSTIVSAVAAAGARPSGSNVPIRVPTHDPDALSLLAPSTEPSTARSHAVLTPGSPPIPPRVSAAISAAVATELTTELTGIDEDADSQDSITATAPRVNAAKLGIVIPDSVEIRTVEYDELLDETEVRTLPGVPLTLLPSNLRASPVSPATVASPPAPRPAAGRPASAPVSESIPLVIDVSDEDDDEPVTTESQASRLGSSTDIGMLDAPTSKVPATQPGASAPKTTLDRASSRARPAAGRPPALEGADEPPTRPGVEGQLEPATLSGVGDPPTGERIDLRSYANKDDDDDDESVTTRGRPAGPYEEDSVTAHGPRVAAGLAVDAQKNTRDSAAPLPADGEAESITALAPGNLTNILRVIASEPLDGVGEATANQAALEDDEPPENRTAVMANAPLNRIIANLTGNSPLPPIRPTGPPLTHGPRGSAAPQLAHSSESGLRVTRGAGSGERVSLGLASAHADGRSSGVGRAAGAASNGSIGLVDARVQGAGGAGGEAGFANAALEQPSVHDLELGRGPRYGLLVGIVAMVSIVVPVVLFVLLQRSSEAVPHGTPAEPASEIQKRDPTRLKAERGKNGVTLSPPNAASSTGSGAASASASASPSAAASSSHKLGQRGAPFRR